MIRPIVSKFLPCNKYFLLVCGFLLLPFISKAQSVFGTITDPEGNAISFVRIYVEGTRLGEISDDEGNYELKTGPGTFRLIFQHLNYVKQSKTIEIKGNTQLRLDIRLSPTDIQIATIEIQAGKKDPAYAIMAKVISHKKENRKQFDSYTCETYQKIKLETDTLPSRKERRLRADSLKIPLDSLPPYEWNWEVSKMIESQSSIHFKRPATYKTIVNAFRDFKVIWSSELDATSLENKGSTGDYNADIRDPYLFYTDVSDADINFYRNLIQIPSLGDRPFVSPLNSTMWRLTYKYKLEETFFEEGNVTYRISILPKNRDGPYFRGQIWVEDASWAIKKVELNVLKSGMSFFESFEIRHRYDKTDDGRRVLGEEEYLYEIKEGRSRFKGNSIAIHSQHQFDVSYPKNFFKNELRRTEKEAFEKDSLQWAALRPMGLTTLEKSFVHKQDSINLYYTSPEYMDKTDSIFNHIGFMDVMFNGMKYRDRLAGMEYYLNSLSDQVQLFAVGGYRHRLGGDVEKTFRRGYKLKLGGDIDYGFKNKDVKGDFFGRYTYLPKKFGWFSFRYGNIYSQINPFETIQGFFSRGNYVNKEYVGISNRIEVKNGWLLDVKLDFADYRSIDNIALADWSQNLFGESNIPPSFDPFREFLVDIQLRYTPGQKYHMEPYRKVNLGSKWPTFLLHYKKAVPGLFGSDIDYNFLELGLNHEFKPGAMGISRWAVRSGKYLTAKKILFTDFKFFRGSDPLLFADPLRAFQSLGPTISTKNAYFRANYIHDFGGVLMDKIPLLKRTRLQSSGGAGMLLIQDGGFFHSEVYVGLQYPLRIRRERFKIGGYFVTSYSNHNDAIGAQWKIGVSYYNTVRNRWEY